MRKIAALLVFLSLLVVSAGVSAEEWTAPDTELYSGDYNADGLPDLYLKAKSSPQVVTIPYDISINVDVATGNRNIVLLNNGDGTYTLIYDPSPDSLAAVSWTLTTSHELRFGDFNSNGVQDLLVQATSIGGVSVVIHATTAGEVPAIAETVVRTQTTTDEDVTARTPLDPAAGNGYSLGSGGDYVGAIDGSFAVSTSGKPVYRIPLNLLPSVQDIAPDLALEYTGNSGNSILGIGWHVDGLSKIKRCGTTLDQDGYINGVNFNSSDKFCLNGQRLITVSGTYGANLTEYRTENESYARVVSFGSLGSGPQYFIVKHATGEIEEYGNTADSRRLAQSGSSAAVTWAINRKSDREGNYVDFTYNTNTASGYQYIHEVKYTGNTGEGLTPGNTVRFNYESRTDVTPSYADGAIRVIPVRVDNIELYLGASLVRKYDLTYGMGTATSRSRLIDISECLGDGKCLPKTVFTWDLGNKDVIFAEQSKEIDTSSYPSALTYENQQYQMADVNGDGRSDLIWTYRHVNNLGRVLYLANSSSSGFTLASSAVETGFNASTIPDTDQSYFSGDVNGDGKADLVWIARYLDDLYYVTYLANAEGTDFVSQGYQVDSQSDHAQYSDGHHHLADVNGDGRQDFVWTFIHQNKVGRAVYLAYTDAGGYVAFGKVSYDIDTDYTPDYYAHNQYVTGDANGDGKDDFLWSFVYQEEFYQVLYLANANGTGFNKISVQNDTALHELIDAYNDIKVQLADANADGKLDLVWTYNVNNRLGRSLYLASDLGTSFVKKSSVLDPAGSRTPDTYTFKETRLGDLNGDGRADVLFSYNNNQNFGWIAYLSDTDVEGFTERQSAEIPTMTQVSYVNQHYLLGDVNADGKTDLLWAYNDVNNHNLERVPFTLPASHPDHITGIADGLNNQTTINYRYLADTGSGFYTKGADATYPVRDDEGLSYVVDNILQSDGVGGMNQWNYAYEGARSNLHGRGFLGFEKRIVTDLQSGFVTTETYRQAFPFIGMQDSAVVETSSSTPIEKVFNHWKQATVTHAGGRDTVFRYLDDSVALKYNLTDGNLVFASLTENTYNPVYGNLNQEAMVTGTGFTGPIDGSFVPGDSYSAAQVSGGERTIKTDYSYLSDASSNWRIGFVDAKTETYDVPGVAQKVVVTQYTPYNSSSFLTLDETQFAGSNVWVKNTYARDGYGNITSITVEAADIVGGIIPRQTIFGAYTNGLYPASKTNPLTHTEYYQYNPRIGELSQIMDANSLITDFIYDDFGRLVYQKAADSTDTRTIYDFCTSGCQTNEAYKATTTVSHQYQNGVAGAPTVTRYYNSYGRELRSDTTGFGGQTIRETKVYDNRGRVSTRAQPYYVGTTPENIQFFYDDLDRVTVENQPDGGVTTNVYLGDPTYASRTVSAQTVLIPGGATKTITTILKRNSLEQLVEVLDAHTTPTEYTYDAQGYTRTVQVNNNPATTITTETDIAGNKTRLIDPDAGEITYAYNGAGELRHQVFEPSGIAHSITTVRDLMGRIDSRTDDDGATTVVADWVWDTAANGKGLLASINSHDYQKSWQYDAFSRVKQTDTSLFAELTPKVFSYSYDVFSRPAKTVYPSGLVVRIAHNANGYALSNTDVNTGVVYWQVSAMDAFGNVTDEEHGNGLSTVRAYDPETARLESLHTGSATSPTEIQGLTYVYDTAGNLRSRSSDRNLSGVESFTETFIYDNLHRVTDADTTGLASGTRNLTYSYDALGNIKTKTGVSDVGGYHYGEGGAGPHAVSRVVLSGATTNYGYDTKGNMTTAGARNVEYTVFNKPDRITKTGGIETLFRYGPERNRFYQQHTDGADVTKTWYYGGFEVVEKGGTVREKTYQGDYLVHNAVKQYGSPAAATDIRYLHRDHIGSAESITDAAGNELERMAFAPFGSRRQADWEDSDAAFEATLADKTFNTTTHGFTDHEHIDAVGFIHMNGRMYDPMIGRFVSPDDFVQFPEFSQSYNRYSYVLNNPLTHTDESGEVIPFIIYGSILAWRAYSAYDTVTSGVEDAKVVLDENASTSDRVVSGLSIVASVAGGKPVREAVGKLGKKVKNSLPKRKSADKVKSSPAQKSKGNDANTEKAEGTDLPDGSKKQLSLHEKGKLDVEQSTKDATKKADTLKRGPFAKKSIPARGPERNFTKAERDQINMIGNETGCHTCGTKNPGTKSGNHIPDHQPANALNTSGGQQRLYPHCKNCSGRQAGQVTQAKRKLNR